MRPTLIGSRALAYWDDTFECRPDADWDVCVHSDIIPSAFSEGKIEVHHKSLNDYDVAFWMTPVVEDHTVEVNGVTCDVMPLEGLAIIKRSHLWRDKNFDKHMFMYTEWLQEHPPRDAVGRGLLKERIRLTKKAYPQANPSLAKSNEDFFDDAVDKKFDHDWIHELVAHYDRPLYERLKREEGMDAAWCEKDLWELLSHEDKYRCVSEECHVIACERFMIPSNWTHYQRLAYIKALKKVCTTLTSGWFRDWAIDNYKEIFNMYDEDKFKRVKEKTYDV